MTGEAWLNETALVETPDRPLERAQMYHTRNLAGRSGKPYRLFDQEAEEILVLTPQNTAGDRQNVP